LISLSFIGLVLFMAINYPIRNTKTSDKDEIFQNLNENMPFQADDFMPPPDFPNDKFKWDFSNGSMLGFQYERYNDTDYSLGVHYYNITSMPLLFIDEPQFITNYTYCVQLEEIYFNISENKIKPVNNSPLLNVSLVNLTESFFGLSKGYFIPMLPSIDGGGGPFSGWFFMLINPFIPTNDTVLALSWSAQRLKILYELFIGMGELDIESISMAPNNNNIYFKNSATGAYVNLTYYDNGTLIYGELYYYDDEDGWMTITLTTIFDVNPLDELEWDVEVGDCLYFGVERKEYKFNITSIYNYSYYHPQIGTTFLFQVVNASLSMFHPESESWISFGLNLTIGLANELFPAYFIQNFKFNMPLILPLGYDTEKLAMMYNMIGGRDYDQVTFGDSWVKLYNSSTQGFAVLEFSKNGSALLFQVKDINILFDHETAGLYRKNMTIIDSIHSIDIIPLSTSGFGVTLNISVIGKTQLFYSAFDINPINTTKGIGNYGLLFIDVMVKESSNLDQAGTNFQPINITIDFDHTIYKYVKIYYFNTSSENRFEIWKPIPYIKLADGKIMFTVNYSSIFVFVNVPLTSLILVGDDDDDDDEGAPAIPIGNYYLIFIAIAVIGLVIYKKRELFKKQN